MRVFCCRCQVILPQRNLVPATTMVRISAGDPRTRLSPLRKISLHRGIARRPIFACPQQQRAPHVAGLNSAIPSGVFRIGKGLLGETVQLALTLTISHREGTRCDARHILAHSEPSRTDPQLVSQQVEIRPHPRLMMADDPGYGCLISSVQDTIRVVCDRCM